MNCVRSVEHWDRGFESNSRHGCLCVCVVLYHGSGLATADHSSKESYRLCKNDYETEEEARSQQRAVEPFIMMMMNSSPLSRCRSLGPVFCLNADRTILFQVSQHLFFPEMCVTFLPFTLVTWALYVFFLTKSHLRLWMIIYYDWK
jgi:hypothetical protein